jgi:hypothetical protein
MFLRCLVSAVVAGLVASFTASPAVAQQAASRVAAESRGLPSLSEHLVIKRADGITVDRRGVTLRCVTNIEGETAVWMRIGFSGPNAVVIRLAEDRGALEETGLEGARVMRREAALRLTRGDVTVEIEMNPLRVEARSGPVRIALADSPGLPAILYRRAESGGRLSEIALATTPGATAHSRPLWYFGGYGSGAHSFGLRLNNHVAVFPGNPSGRAKPGDAMPFVASTAGYGIWAPPSRPVMFDLRGDPLVVFQSDRCEFHFLLSPTRSLPALLAELTKLTFDLPVPPASIFDPWFSRDSRTPEADIADLRARIRNLELPSGILQLEEWHDRPQFAFREVVPPAFGAGDGRRLHRLAWTGSSLRDFRGLQIMLRATLTAGLSGLPFGGHDIAGGLGPIGAEEREPPAAVMIRWIELAAFTPVMQWHGRGPSRDPWAHSDPQVLATYRDFAWLHVNLRPYLISEAVRAKRNNLPLMRALVLGHPDDRDAGDVDDEYELGEDLLVAPVMTQNVTRRPVYLPNGAWRDFWSDAAWEGGRIHARIPAPLEIIPVFVREGTILPLLLDGAFTPATPLRDTPQLTLRLIPDAEGAARRTLYDARGKPWTVKSVARPDRETGTVSIEANRTPEPVTFWIAARPAKPTRVEANGRRIPEIASGHGLARNGSGWWYDASDHRILVKIPSGGRTRIRVSFEN